VAVAWLGHRAHGTEGRPGECRTARFNPGRSVARLNRPHPPNQRQRSVWRQGWRASRPWRGRSLAADTQPENNAAVPSQTMSAPTPIEWLMAREAPELDDILNWPKWHQLAACQGMGPAQFIRGPKAATRPSGCCVRTVRHGRIASRRRWRTRTCGGCGAGRRTSSGGRCGGEWMKPGQGAVTSECKHACMTGSSDPKMRHVGTTRVS
jgi:hypothetical protein